MFSRLLNIVLPIFLITIGQPVYSACTASGSNGELLVPSACTKIQEAIDAAQNGNTVLVSAGTYTENLSFKGKNITVKSLAGAALTIIDGGRPVGGGSGLEQPVVRFTQNETREAVLQGFTLRNGESSSGGGISIKNASPTISDNVITANYCNGWGNGIHVELGSPRIENNTISHNHNGSGISSGGGGGGGISVQGAGAAEIIGNQIISNSVAALSSGGGIYVFAAGNPLIQNNYIYGNSAKNGAGIGIANSGTEQIIQNLIVGNVLTSSSGQGGGIHISGGGKILLLNNTITDNRNNDAQVLNPDGLQLYLSGSVSDLRIINNLIRGGNAVYCDTTDAQFVNNNVSAYGGSCPDHTGSSGNIAKTSLLVGGSGTAAYRLKTTSPELDAGQNVTELPAQDFAGNTRVSDDDGDSIPFVDIGAFEGVSRDSLSIQLIGNGSGTISAPAGLGTGINCGSQCSESFATGTQITLTATPAQGSVFQGWAGDCSGSNNSLSVTLNSSMSCYASFNLSSSSAEPNVLSFTPTDTLLLVNTAYSFTLTWTKGGQAQQKQLLNLSATLSSVTPKLLVTDAQGQVSFSLSATQAASDTLLFKDISGNTVQTLALRYVNSLADVATLSVQTSGTGSGTISSSSKGLQGDGISCGANCSESYNRNTSVTLTTSATAATSRFLSWGGDCSGTSSTLQIVMDGNKTCTATYESVTGNLIETIAGNGSSGFAGDGGAALAAKFNLPAGLAIDSSGAIYLADASNHRIRKINAQGVISSVAGNGVRDFSGDGGQAANAALNFPSDVAVDSSGNLYIADSYNNRIRKVAADGAISTIAGSGTAGFSGDGAAASAAQLNRPTGVALDGSGNLYIADSRNQRVRKVSTDGTISTVAGNGTTGFSGDGLQAIAAQLSSPVAVAFDAVGNLYVVDQGNQRVRFVSPQGIITTLVGTGTAGFGGDGGTATAAQLNNPLDVAVDSGGQIYLSDNFNHRIRRVANGVIDTIAGTGDSGYSGDGLPAVLAKLNQPWGVAVNADGQVIFSSSASNVLRRVDTRTTVVTPPTPPAETSAALTVSLSGDGSGTVTAPVGQGKGINCGTQCSEVYDKGATVLLTATANSNSSFIAWTGACQGTDKAISLTLDSSKSCTAQFTLNTSLPYQSLTISLNGSGSGRVTAAVGKSAGIDCGSVCAETYDTGLNIQILANANDGSEFSGWRGDCGGVLTPLTLKMDRAYTCEAVFNLLPFTAAQGEIDTIAGNGNADFSGDAGQAVDAALKFPTGIVLDSHQRLLMVDALNNRIRAVENGFISTVAGLGSSGFSGDGGNALQAQFASPTSMTISRTGEWYIADTNNHRIRRVGLDGIISTVAGTGAAGSSGDNGSATLARLNLPYTVAVDNQGNLLIADSNNHRVRRVDISGRITALAGTGEAGYSGDGEFAAFAQLNFPSALLFKSTGELLIADSGNHRIRQVDNFGKISTLVGSGASGFAQGSFAGDSGAASAARLNNPRGLALDAAGNLYIADSSNHRVRQVTPQGIISTVAGIGNPGFSGDGGAPRAAALNNPAAVWMDSSGNLYIADSGNHRIRRVAQAYPELSIGKLGLGSGTVTAAVGLGDGIDCGDNCRENYPPGTTVTLQATPDAGSQLAGWQGCTPLPSDATQVSVLIQGNRTCTAQFNLAGAGSACPPTGIINRACNAQDITLTGVTIAAAGVVYSGTLASTNTSQGVVYNVQFAAGAVLNGGEIGGNLVANAEQPAMLTNVRVQAGSRLSNLILGANVQLADDVVLEPLRYLNSSVVPRQADGTPKDFTPHWTVKPSPCAGTPQPATLDMDYVMYADKQSLLAEINQIPVFSNANLHFIQTLEENYLQRDDNNQRLLLRPVSVHHSNSGVGRFIPDTQQNGRFLTANGLDLQAQPALQGLCEFASFLRDNGLNDLSVDNQGNLRQPMPDGKALLYVRPSAYLNRLANAVAGLGVKLDSNGLDVLTWKQNNSDGTAVYEQMLYPTAYDIDALKQLAGDALSFTANGEMRFDDGQLQYRWRFDYLVTPGSNPSGAFALEPSERPEDFMLVYPTGERQLLVGLPL